MAKVIGVCGAIGAGKGEVAKRLAEALELPEYAYAQGLKTIVAAIGTGQYPETREYKETTQVFTCKVGGIFAGVSEVFDDFEGSELINLSQILLGLLQELEGFQWVRQSEGTRFTVKTSYRELYQLVGTDWARKHIHPDVWILRRPLECVVNDVRAFEKAPDPYAEAKAIIADGGVVLRVIREVATEDDRTNGHESEFPMSDAFIYCDVDNNGTLDDLDETLDPIIEDLIERFAEPKVKDDQTTKVTKGSKRKAAAKPKVSSSKDGDSE